MPIRQQALTGFLDGIRGCVDGEPCVMAIRLQTIGWATWILIAVLVLLVLLTGLYVIGLIGVE